VKNLAIEQIVISIASARCFAPAVLLRLLPRLASRDAEASETKQQGLSMTKIGQFELVN
jgi:hypothetical protein